VETTLAQSGSGAVSGRPTIKRIAVGVDGYPEGRDAVALGFALARVTTAELMLVAVHSDPLVVLPEGMNWTSLEQQAKATLNAARDSLAPGARIDVETDLSVPRALQRVVRREHRDLLVVGSSRHATDGRVRIGKRTRQLLCHFECPLAVAPRGLRDHPDLQFQRIGVGYDGEPEAETALALAGSIALAAGAELRVRAVVDDRMPPVGWPAMATGALLKTWEQAVEEQMASLQVDGQTLGRATGADARVEATRGRPADALLELSEDVDLLVIGSRRWGPASRLLLGSTGEAVMHDARCPVLAVPRPSA
jgi:nucleotide-binding universal stress UspA family protein